MSRYLSGNTLTFGFLLVRGASADLETFGKSFMTWPVLWPKSRLQATMSDGIAAGRIEQPIYEQRIRYSGTAAWKRISGITKDSTGASLAAATVKAYRVTDGENNRKDQIEGVSGVSAVDGAYEVMVPTSDTYYLVAYKVGSPDVAGTSVNTLVGT